MDCKKNTAYAAFDRWMRKYPVSRCVRQSAVRIADDIKAVANHHVHTFSFLKAVAMNPRATGAILPSSRRLARAMASCIQVTENTLVVELGAGTGVITQAILDRGVPPGQVIAVEYCAHLAQKLRQRFPGITVIEGNAAHLTDLLKNSKQEVSTIISGLPLRSLPLEIKERVIAEIPEVLSATGRYIQFTYDIRNGQDFYPSHYQLTGSKIIWRNVPPAKIGVYSCHN